MGPGRLGASIRGQSARWKVMAAVETLSPQDVAACPPGLLGTGTGRTATAWWGRSELNAWMPKPTAAARDHDTQDHHEGLGEGAPRDIGVTGRVDLVP